MQNVLKTSEHYAGLVHAQMLVLIATPTKLSEGEKTLVIQVVDGMVV